MKRSLKIGLVITALPFYVLIGIDYFHQDLEDVGVYKHTITSGPSYNLNIGGFGLYGQYGYDAWYGYYAYFDNCTSTSYKEDYMDWKTR